MSSFAITAADVWRDHNTAGVPASGAHPVSKADARAWGAAVESALTDALSSGASVVFTSLTTLNASLGYAANTRAELRGDATAANDGIYRKNGSAGLGSWSRVADLPDEIVRLTVSGGTANAIETVGSPYVSGGNAGRRLYFFKATAANTLAAVTMKIGSGSAKPLRTGLGSELGIGAIVSGATFGFIDDGTEYRLVVDPRVDVLAAQAASDADAAETARIAAEGARDDAEAAAATTAIDRGLNYPFATRAALAAATIPASVKQVATQGYAVSYDLGGCRFRRVAAEPSHEGKIRTTDRYLPDGSTSSSNGGWWEINEEVLHIRMFGAKADNATDDYLAIQSALDAAGNRRVDLGVGSILCSVGLVLDKIGQTLFGHGTKTTLLKFTFASGNQISIGNSSSFVERQTIQDFLITTTVTRTGGFAVFCDHCNNVQIINVKAEACYDGLKLGDTDLAACGGVYIRDSGFSTARHGCLITSAAGTFFINTGFSGYDPAGINRYSPGHGVLIQGPADGVFSDTLSVIQDYNRGLMAAHGSGSCASVDWRGKVVFCRTAHFSIECSGTASINGFYVRGCEIVGYGQVEQALLIVETSSGAISGVVFADNDIKNIGQRIVQTSSACAEIDIRNNTSRDGGVYASGTYPAVDFAAQAHTRAMVVGNRFNGVHNYGLYNPGSVAVLLVGLNEMVGTAGVVNSFGAANTNRRAWGNIGYADAG